MVASIGIDLGTTKSAVAVWRNGAPEIIPDPQRRSIMPSVVAIDPANGQWEVGWRAREIGFEHPASAVSSIKRLIGRRFDDEVVQTSLRESRVLYRVEESQRRSGAIEVTLGGKHLTPQEISAKILQKLKAQAETSLGQEVTRAVVSVPAYFHDSQRQATRDAGRIAGLDVRRVVNEPTAACLAYGYKKLADERRLVAVYDLGGGTFDISILEVGRGPIRVRATNGDTFLGGDDLNLLIVEWILREVGGVEQARLQTHLPALAKLRAAAESAKKELSSSDETRIRVPGLLRSTSSAGDLDLTLTRTQLESIAAPWIERTFEPCRLALSDAGLVKSDIAEVLLVGGQTRMPAIRKKVQEFFGTEPNTSLPPEEVVALGAAAEAAIENGEAVGLRLLDVVPLSLGVKSLGGLMDVIVPRNSPLPLKKQRSYSTSYDDQDSVEVQVYQGEKPMVAENISLGSFILRGIPPAPRGIPNIEVTFTVDDDGILHVSGVEKQTGSLKEITVTDSVRLGDDEIAAMVRDAEEHAAEYELQYRETLQRLQLEQQVAELQAMLEEREATIPAAVAQLVRDALAVASPEDPAARLEKLRQLWQLLQKS